MSSLHNPRFTHRRGSIGEDPARGQVGGTLIEVLLAVAILSILMLGVMGGMTMTAKVSGTTGNLATTRAALTSTIDRVATMPYPGCQPDVAALTNVVRAANVVPNGYAVSVSAVTYVVPAAASCTSATSAQLLTLVVTKNGTTVRASGQVAVRDRRARPPA